MEIRLVEESEYDAVAALIVAVYVDGGFIPVEADYVNELRDTAGRAHDSEVWVALEDGLLLGTVTYCPAGSGHREVAQDGEGEFRMLAVDPSARGRGLGETLVRHCLARSQAAGDHAMALSTMEEMTGAHRIYGRLGFVRTPAKDWTPGRDVCLWAFRLDY
ncbi:Acetyltransferase, N-acetylglutamate synthase [metagenome]|uniref:Acetyltransferase, N-acetylglutamate synthase n=1 Tax=metagenome TaxID=256318 RepID=A0A2P2C1J2_9ZZZZ